MTRKQSTPNFPKNEHFLPLTCAYVCVSEGKKCSFFWKIWRALFSCCLHFEIRVCLITDELITDEASTEMFTFYSMTHWLRHKTSKIIVEEVELSYGCLLKKRRLSLGKICNYIQVISKVFLLLVSRKDVFSTYKHLFCLELPLRFHSVSSYFKLNVEPSKTSTIFVGRCAL